MPKPLTQIINEVIKRETVDGEPTDFPNDPGRRTQYGISEKANPEAWADGKVTKEEAENIYRLKYIEGPRFDTLPEGRFQEFLVDYGVLSGPSYAISKLQEILGVKADGILGPITLAALTRRDLNEVRDRMIDNRILGLVRIVQKRPYQLEDLFGWIRRTLEFRCYND